MHFAMMSSPRAQRAVLTFYDFDDTAIVLPHSSDTNQKKRIKNPQLFLPILLFQTLFPNQHIGILTNRTVAESEILADPTYDKKRDYLVAEFIQKIAKMGISMPKENIIFGGEFRAEKEASLGVLAQAKDILAQQLRSDSLDAGARLKIEQTVQSYDQTLTALYAGKNYFIRKFLDQHLDSGVYTFASAQCAQQNLTVVMVDDLRTITDICAAAGYIGIKAARGGKLPDFIADVADSTAASASSSVGSNLAATDDYYSDSYFMELANTIGFGEYAQSLIEHPEAHVSDLPMIKISALLYAWHVQPEKVFVQHFRAFEDEISAAECEQLLQMMRYIKKHANEHQEAHYNPVDKLYDLFSAWHDSKYLDNVLQNYQSQKRALEQEKRRVLSSASMPDLPSLPKSRSFKIGRKSKARSDMARGHRTEPAVSERFVEIEVELRKIEQRVQILTRSENRLLQEKALAVEKQMQRAKRSGGWHRSNASSSSSSRHAGAGVDSPPVPTFTPQRGAAGAHRQRRDAVVGDEEKALAAAVRRLSIHDDSDSSDGGGGQK